MIRLGRNRSPLVVCCRIGAAVLGCFVAIGAKASTTTVDAGRGPVTVRVPEFGSGPRPLILELHGYSSNAADTENVLFQLGSRAEAAGMLLAMPEGTLDATPDPPGPQRFWNATDACCDFFGSGVDDVGYLLDVIDEIDEQLGGVDRERIYFVGHSNGGFMAYRMACEHADLVAAVVSLAGATFGDETDCAPSRPVPVLAIHGRSDDVIKYIGGVLPPPSFPPPYFDYPGAIETAQTWAAYNGCDPENHMVGSAFDGLTGGTTLDATVDRYEHDCSGPHAELWTLAGGEHVPPPTLTETLRDRLFAWLLLAGSRLQRDGFETGDATLWDRSEPPMPP